MIKRAKQFASLLIIIASLSLVSYSQSIPCELNIRLFALYSSDLLDEAKIQLKDFANENSYKPVQNSNSISFNGLNSGIYEIELSKAGYRQKIKKFLVDCSLANKTNKVFENIYLWKGNSKELIRLDTTKSSVPFVVTESDKESKKVTFETTEKVLGGHAINGKFLDVVRPIYPSAARAVRASGPVNVQVTIDEDGNVIKAEAVSGHMLLQESAVRAAKQSKFSPTLLGGKPVKITGVIVFNFSTQ